MSPKFGKKRKGKTAGKPVKNPMPDKHREAIARAKLAFYKTPEGQKLKELLSKLASQGGGAKRSKSGGGSKARTKSSSSSSSHRSGGRRKGRVGGHSKRHKHSKPGKHSKSSKHIKPKH